MYQVHLTRAVTRALDHLRERGFQRIGEAVDALAHEPRPSGAQPVKGTRFHRIRAGDYRVVYQIDDADRVVLLVRVARRTERTYKGL